MSNPFLFDDPAPSSGAGPDIGNPFLSSATFDAPASAYSGINPFGDIMTDETSSAAASTAINLFGDSSTYAPEMNPFGPVTTISSNIFDSNQNMPENPELDLFGNSTPNQQNSVPPVNNLFGTIETHHPPPKPPPPRPPSPATTPRSSSPVTRPAPPRRPPPPSKETKDLLQTVIGAMEATTDTLQDKLNATRTPCPSPGSIGGHNSRSPTPDITITAPEKESDAFSTIFGQTIEINDEEEGHSSQTATTEVQASDASTNQDIDLFGDTPPTTAKPKTTQDIMKLFNKPEQPKQVDLLSDDIVAEDRIADNNTKPSEAPTPSETPMPSEMPTVNITESTEDGETPRKGSIVTTPDRTSPSASGSPELLSEKSDSEPPTVIESTVKTTQAKSESDEAFVDKPLNGTNTEIKNESSFVPAKEPVEDIFGVPKSSEVILQNNLPPRLEDNNEVSNIFEEESQSVPLSEETDIFHDKSESPVPPAPVYEASSVEDTSALPSPPAAALFGDVSYDNEKPLPPPPDEVSTGFNIFGETSEPAPSVVPSGADSIGATLFETSAPAPNVGMSLFGGGDEATLDIFAESHSNTMVNPFAPTSPAYTGVTTLSSQPTHPNEEEFDAFSARFDNVVSEPHEPTLDPFGGNRAASPWGDASSTGGASTEGFGFGDNAKFDPFLSMNEPPPVPQSTPRRIKKDFSNDSDDTPMNVVIRPSTFGSGGISPAFSSPVPVLAPPPVANTAAFTDSTPRLNPFDKSATDVSETVPAGVTAFPGEGLQRSESQETPPTPLFEEDQSVPLEPFPRTIYDGRTWEMHLRQPNKKKITGQRFWKKVYVKLADGGALQLYNNIDDKEPFQELPLQPCYSVSDIGAQQFDQFGKIFTVKVQYIFYKERPGVRPGQISKAEKITNKLSKFAQYAIAGDYEGVKEFASDVRKLGMPVEHAPQISQLLKLGTQNYEELKIFANIIEEFMFKLTVHRDRALTYKSEEVQLTAVDEMFVEQDVKGVVHQMVARVRIFFLGFLSGMPEVDLGINDLKKQGNEVVGRHDIIPVVTEEWIRLEDIEFHCTVDQDVFEKTRHIKFKPPDACYIELMRYRVRPPKNRELPLQVKTKITIQGKRIDLLCEILVPGFSGRKLGQVPCEDVAVRFPLPECWIYMFRVEKHFRYGSVKSAHRRTGKVKGIERLKGAVETAEAALMEVTSGQAKYEHQHRAIVWRINRLPKEGQGAYSMHQFTCRMNLTAYDQMPESLDKYCIVEFTMPATTVSHCVMRSVSVTSEEPPEKYVRYLARHEYKVEIDFASPSGPNDYIAATMKDPSKASPEQKKEPLPPTVQEESSSDESN